MAELLRPYAEARPDEPAVTDERGVTTWREFEARVDRLAGALRGLGLDDGDAIAIHSGNRREYFELMAAATHIGLRYVVVNWHWTADELKYVLADSRARAVFSEDAFGQQAADLIKRVAAERKDFDIVLSTSAALRATDLTAPALAVRRSNADSVLVLSAAGATMAGAFIRKLRELGSTLPIYGSAALAQPATVRAAGDAAEGMTMAAIFNPHEAGPLQPLFEALAPHGGAQGFGSLLGAASAATIIEGLKAGATDGATLRDTIERLPPFTPFSAGTVQYTPDDHDGWGAKNLLLVTVRSGRFVNRGR